MKKLLLRSSQATHDEWPAAAWSFLYFFFLLAGYYVLRPIRDEMGLQLGADALKKVFTGVFLVMLVLVPLFGWLNRLVPRRRLLPWLYGFFAANLVMFHLLFAAAGNQLPWVAGVFFVWVSVFNLFVISVFWSFMADLYSTDQAKRLYGFISAGGTLGALTGPTITVSLVDRLGPHNLLLVSAAFLGLAIVAIFRLRAWSRRLGVADSAVKESGPAGETAVMKGSVVSGIVDVLRSPYLRNICFFMLAYSLLSTTLYFISADLLGKEINDSRERTKLLAQIDLAVNVLALVLQLVVFKGLMNRLGTRFVLGLLPVVSVLGFAALAWTYPLVGVLVVFGVLRRAGEYALSKPARETLFNVLPPEQQYKAKNVIDTLVHRTGDTASAWVYGGLREVHIGVPQIAWMSAAVAVGWWLLALSLGTRARALQAQRAAP